MTSNSLLAFGKQLRDSGDSATLDGVLSSLDSKMNQPRIAFFGLGIMGSGMARRLLANGYPLSVFNRTAEKSKSFAAGRARVAVSPRDAAEGADVIISMVADDHAARAVWLGAQGALAGAKPGVLCIESSTVTVGWVRELAAAAQGAKCEFLDAPVTGSKSHAASGELSFLVGGDSSTLEKARPVLMSMGKAIIHLGPTGSGALVKLINNFVCGVQIAALAEALAMIEDSSLDRTKALEILTQGAPGSPLVKAVATRMTTPDFTPNFLLRLMAKDLGYAIQEGAKISAAPATARAALELFQTAIAKGYGEEDIAAVIKPMRRHPL